MTAVSQQMNSSSSGRKSAATPAVNDLFAGVADVNAVKQEAARKALAAARAEIEALIREKRWQDALTLFHPVEDKIPELSDEGLDTDLREKIAFALGQVNRFDEAIDQLKICLVRRPENYYLHNSLAYTAYNSLYAAINREIFLRGKHRLQRIELAHRHFVQAQQIRPDGITNYYRQAMLYKQIEGKPAKALPLFCKAIENWRQLDQEARDARHQERKNYVKALYNGASAALTCHRARQALDLIRRCLEADAQTDYIAAPLRYFALGKVFFHLNRFEDARKALETALQATGSKPLDFAVELLARTFLCVGNWRQALDTLGKIPPNRRRPYICWTEADALCASGDLAAATRVLEQAAGRDNRSRHKTLVRLARIAYLRGDFSKTRDWAAKALVFFRENWGKDLDDALFWAAVGELKCGNAENARKHALRLKDTSPDYPRLNHLLEAIA